MSNVFDRVKAWSSSRGITSQDEAEHKDWFTVNEVLDSAHVVLSTMGVSGYVLNKVEELVEYADAKSVHDENGTVDAIADSMVYDMTELLKKGYDPQAVIDEVLKVVESRTGKWDDELGKFVKDKTPEAKARWYEPDYVKNCKLNCPKSYIGSLFEEHCSGRLSSTNS